MRLLREEPALLAINARVRQKPLAQRAASALIRCDGGRDIGLGHVYRCLALADELRDRRGIGVAFAVQTGTAAFELVGRAGHALERAPEGIAEEEWLEGLVAGARRTSWSSTSGPRSRARPWTACARGSGSSRPSTTGATGAWPAITSSRLPCRRCGSSTGPPCRGELHCGFEWILLRPQFARAIPREAARGAPRVLVAMGGSDPAGLTLKAVDALDALAGDFEARLLVGPAFAHGEALAARLSTARRRFEVLRGAEDVAGLMSQSDLAIVSFGMTAYELSALGVPAVLLCLTEDHARSASALADAGAALSLGVHERIAPGEIAAAAGALLRDPERRGALSRAASSLIDGRGAEQTAEILARAIARRSGR